MVQALLFSPRSAGFAPFPSASAFLFSCPFRVCPLRARCVGVGVCSLPLLLRSPPRVPAKRLSNFPCHLHVHLTLILVFILTFISFSGLHPAQAERLNRRKTSSLAAKAGDHRGPGGAADQPRHLPGTRANVPAGLWWCTCAQLSRS